MEQKLTQLRPLMRHWAGCVALSQNSVRLKVTGGDDLRGQPLIRIGCTSTVHCKAPLGKPRRTITYIVHGHLTNIAAARTVLVHPSQL